MDSAVLGSFPERSYLFARAVKNVEDLDPLDILAVIDEVFPSGEAPHSGSEFVRRLACLRIFPKQPETLDNRIN